MWGHPHIWHSKYIHIMKHELVLTVHNVLHIKGEKSVLDLTKNVIFVLWRVDKACK